MKHRLSVNEKGELLTRDGTVVGQLTAMTLDIDPAALRGEAGEAGGAMGGVVRVERTTSGDSGVQASASEEQPHGGMGEMTSEPQLFEHDPVKEVFEHYCNTVPGKANSRLTQDTRRLIRRALDERPIDQLKLAINGLAVSQHHIEGGWTAIKYAIGKTRVSETVGDRIDMMAAKAPKQSASGEITVEELLRTVPSDRHWIIRETMSLVIQAIKRGERAEREEEMLLRSPGVKPIINDGQFAGWERVS